MRAFPTHGEGHFLFTLLYKYTLAQKLQFVIMYSPGGNKPNGSGKHPATLFKNLGFYKKRYRLSLLNKGTENMLKESYMLSDVVKTFTVADAEHFIKTYLNVYDLDLAFIHKDGQIIMQTKPNHTLH